MNKKKNNSENIEKKTKYKLKEKAVTNQGYE